MTNDIKKFSTRKTFDESTGATCLAPLLHAGQLRRPRSVSPASRTRRQARRPISGRRQHYLLHGHAASVFGLISGHLSDAGFKKREKGWTRIIVEKPFGHDLPSAIELNLSCWPIGLNRRSTGSTITLARRPSRTCSPSASPTASSSRSGTRTMWTTSSLPSPRRSASKGAANTTTRRRAARHDPEPHVPDAGLPVHGAASVVQAGRHPQREVEAPRRRPRHDAGRGCA